jgi:hypothetical protein
MGSFWICQVLGTLAFVAPEAWTGNSNFGGHHSADFSSVQWVILEDFGRVQQFVGRFLEDFGPVLKIHHFGHRSFPIPEGRARIPSFSYVQPGSHFGPLRPVCSDSGTNQQTQASSSLSSPILSHTDMALWDFFFGKPQNPMVKNIICPTFWWLFCGAHFQTHPYSLGQLYPIISEIKIHWICWIQYVSWLVLSNLW